MVESRGPGSTVLTDSLKLTPRIVIAGAGISGICLAIQLKRSGIESFQIFEKSSDCLRDEVVPALPGSIGDAHNRRNNQTG